MSIITDSSAFAVSGNPLTTNDQKPSRGVSAERLRVLLYLFFPGSGIGRYSHELMRHFQGITDIEAELVCLPSYHWLDRADYAIWPGLREIGHPHAIRRKARFLIAQLANPARLARRVRERSADLVHLCNINHLTYPLWSRWLTDTKVRIAATAHDVRRAKAMLSRTYEDRQLQQFYRRADALFVHSQSQLADLQEFAGVPSERIHIVPHGPYDYGRPSAEREVIRRRLGWPLDKQVALFFGNIRDDKNLDLMLRALQPHRDSVHLVVAGRGAGGAHQGVAHYRALAESLGLAPHVTFDERYIEDEEIPNLFEASDWAALPYSRSFTSQSGVLNVAATYRRPVLLSDTPTFAETLGQANVGVLAAADDVEALTAGVGAITEAVRNRRPFEFDKYLQMFGWESNVRITCDVYRSLCG